MKFMLPANFAPKAYLKRALRRHLGGVGKSPDGRAQKMAKLEAHLRPDMPRKTLGGKLDFLTEELRKQARIAETDNISSNDYDENGLALIEKYMDGLILDCGAGRRSVYYKNVVNYEIVNYDSTDVIGIGEELPFKDGTFDAVISVAVLEPIQEDWIQEHWVERVRRLSMMRIMARRTKAATVLV